MAYLIEIENSYNKKAFFAYCYLQKLSLLPFPEHQEGSNLRSFLDILQVNIGFVNEHYKILFRKLKERERLLIIDWEKVPLGAHSELDKVITSYDNILVVCW